MAARNTTDSLFALWAKRDAYFETHFQDEIISKFSDYGVGSSKSNEAKGKTFGGGYEMFIIAFFIGLYSDCRRELDKSLDKKKFGYTIENWGDLNSKPGRKSYPEIRKHIFASLIAKTEIDLIALEKGELEASDVVSTMIDAMNEYANYGFYYLAEKLKDNPNSLYRNSGFLDIFLDLTKKTHKKDEELEEL